MYGHCTCGKIRYRLTETPLFVHACHCTWCQRETGGPHAINAMIETDRVDLMHGAPMEITTPSASGKGQIILRCPECCVALWSHYAGAGRKLAFVRVGTLETPAACPPDIHIFTSTKLPWYILPENVLAVPDYYDRTLFWPRDSLERLARLRGRPLAG